MEKSHWHSRLRLCPNHQLRRFFSWGLGRTKVFRAEEIFCGVTLCIYYKESTASSRLRQQWARPGNFSFLARHHRQLSLSLCSPGSTCSRGTHSCSASKDACQGATCILPLITHPFLRWHLSSTPLQHLPVPQHSPVTAPSNQGPSAGPIWLVLKHYQMDKEGRGLETRHCACPQLHPHPWLTPQLLRLLAMPLLHQACGAPSLYIAFSSKNKAFGGTAHISNRSLLLSH